MTAPDPVARLVDRSDESLSQDWASLQKRLMRRFGRIPGIEAVLYLVGLQDSAGAWEGRLEKQAKQDLIMQGTYRVFEHAGLYRRRPDDTWERIVSLPVLEAFDQERLLRAALVDYFNDVVWASD